MPIFTCKALRLTIGSAAIAAVGFFVSGGPFKFFTHHCRRSLQKFFPSTRRQTSHVINTIVIALQSSSRETENNKFRRLLSDCLYCDDHCSALHPLTCFASKNGMGLDLTNEAATFSCFIARSQNCEKRLLASSCVSIRPSARMEQLVFHWTDFHEI
jgi:hypothetical protein